MDKSGQLQQPDYEKLLQKQDFFPKIFLVPSEIRLHKDQGLMVIKRNENHPDKFEEEQVLPITVDQKQIRNFDENPDTVRHPAGHGLLSLFKRTSKRRIKLAICICVYSQPKHMLKSTIKGIQQSYKYFLDNAGIMPHEIILIVIFDGIEKINNSKDQTENMISYFNEIDLKNGFRHKQYGQTLEDYLKQLEERNFNFSSLNDDKMDNINLFTEDELNSLKSKLFENQYNEYIRIKSLLKQIEALKKEKDIKVDRLPHDVHKKYQELCMNFCVENNMWYETQEEIQEYLSSKKNIKIKLIYEALHETQMLCRRYIDSRLDKTILYPVRMEDDDLKNPRIDLNESQTKTGDYEKAKQYNYMFFCVKHKNEGKLSSHMLFFEGFCKLFDPQYCILTDVGVKPKEDAIYKMWAHMEKNPQCGGVCGYMGCQLQNPSDELGYRDDGYQVHQLSCLTTCCDYFFTVQRAQQFEYHFAHMLDKPFQAAFGYIHVLPGAFSGYRWKALKSVTFKQEQEKYIEGSESQRYTYENSEDSQKQQQETLMKRYLKTALSEKLNISLQDSNMYLAEDRIMCLGIHALGYTLDYLPDAESVVDPVTSLTRLLGQRRRWINGSWFAFTYVSQHSYQSTSCLFFLQLLYYRFVQKVSWIQVSIFYVTMNLTLISAVQSFVVPAVSKFFLANNSYQLYNYKISIFNISNVIDSIPDIINFLYIVLLFGNLLYGVLVNNNNDRYKKLYYISSTILGIYGLIVITLLVVNSISIIIEMYHGQGKEQFIIPLVYLRALIMFVIIGHALPIIWTFSFKKYVEMLTSVLSYIYYSPTYVNLLQMFAFSRIDDLSWGTKGLDNDVGDGVQRSWQRRKFIFILQYISTNSIFSYVLIKLTFFDYPRNIIILSSTCLVAFLLGFRLIFAAIYLVKYYAKRPWKVFSSSYINQNRANGNRILNALKMIQLKIKQIEKQKTKKKKEQQYKKLANATSQILSKTLSNFGNKLRSKVAHHMVNNNIIPKKQLLDPKKKLKNRRKVNLKKNLNPVEQLSNQQSEQSKTIGKPNIRQSQKQKEQKDDGYDIVIPETTKKNELRARIQAIRQKRNKSAKKI